MIIHGLFDFLRGMIFRRTPLFLNDMAEDYDLLKESVSMIISV